MDICIDKSPLSELMLSAQFQRLCYRSKFPPLASRSPVGRRSLPCSRGAFLHIIGLTEGIHPLSGQGLIGFKIHLFLDASG